jgi:probable HAF family extracellular repeat protein
MGLGDLPGGDFLSRARAISADGKVVVGESQSASGQEAYRWTLSDGIQGLGDLPGDLFQSAAYGTSADGSVIVGYGYAPVAGARRAFRWTQATGMVSLGGSRRSNATGVSADGTVITGSVNSLPPFPEGNAQAFRWTDATGMVDLGFINATGADFSEGNDISADGTVVVGWSATQAFRWTQATDLVALPGLGGTGLDIARAVSGDGLVIVGSADSPSSVVEEAFRWTQATGTVGLGDLPGGIYSSAARATSADGSVVVGSSSTGTPSAAFIWDADHGMRNLQDLLVNSYGLASSLAGWSLTSATAISGNGRIIAGNGISPNGQPEAWIASLVPEPTSISLLIMCGAALTVWPRNNARG